MIRIEHQGDVAIVHMEHGKANALDLELCVRLREDFASLEEAPVRAVVVTGRGSIFSAGVDLLRILDEGAPYLKRFLPALSDLCEAVFPFPKPLVAAINGHAIAGGCVFACLADRKIVARDGGRIGVPELLVGVPFPPAPLEVLRFAVPTAHFGEIVFTGESYHPAGARDRGLADEMVEADLLMDRAVRLADQMGSLPPEAFRITKQEIRAPIVERIRATRPRLDPIIEEIWSRPETLERIRDYVSSTFKR